jgi:hypothetical protein
VDELLFGDTEYVCEMDETTRKGFTARMHPYVAEARLHD